ncbi:MAG: YggS family pyridoxal phosphate-dependent enzyme, partial [Terriglobia bacterium]
MKWGRQAEETGLMGVRENIEQVKERIGAACRRVGRRAEEVKLIAVSKTVPAERIREAYEAGLREFGENRVQEAAAK